MAITKTVFKIKDKIKKDKIVVYKVTTDDYPVSKTKNLYIDSRFVTTQEHEPVNRSSLFQQKETIIEKLISTKDRMYVWGGNNKDGVEKMLSLYPPAHDANLNSRTLDKWILKGVDCSGLLYEATDGYTPRNTDALTDYGKAVMIEGLNAGEIIEKIRPLDLIVWQGHVIIILDRERTIESRLDYDKKTPGCQGGVRIRLLEEVLEEVMSKRMPADRYSKDVKVNKNKFVIRRWHIDN